MVVDCDALGLIKCPIKRECAFTARELVGNAVTVNVVTVFINIIAVAETIVLGPVLVVVTVDRYLNLLAGFTCEYSILSFWNVICHLCIAGNTVTSMTYAGALPYGTVSRVAKSACLLSNPVATSSVVVVIPETCPADIEV